jgi:AraC-like DNA-binding protein
VVRASPNAAPASIVSSPMAVSQWVRRDPAPALRPYVSQYIGYRMFGHPPALHRGLPSPNMALIFSIGSVIDVVSQTSPKQAPRRYQAVAAGLHDTPALIAHDGNQEGVAVMVSPIGSRALFGLPAAELWDLTLEADEVIGAKGRELSERLHLTEDWDSRFTAFDDVLTRLLCEASVAPELSHSWDRLVRSGGRIAVADLAADVGYSRQHLRHRFSQEFGVGPKRAGRLIRFGRAVGMLENSPLSLSKAEVALACGYYDQAHLHREFAAFAGCSPTDLVAGDLPIVQDDQASPQP